MILIGFLQKGKYPWHSLRAYSYAYAAGQLGVEFIYFTLKDVNYEKRRIRGYILSNEKWKKVSRPFPQIIMNAYIPGKQHELRAMYDLLRLEIPYTTFPVGNKMFVTRHLQKGKLFGKYVIPSKKLDSVEELVYFLKQYPKVVIKPVSSCQGKNVYYIEKVNSSYIIEIEDERYRYDYEKFSKRISEKLREDKYLVQPYIHSKTHDGRSFDLRIHVVKNGEGKWTNTTIYARISSNDSIITNIHHGGERVPLDTFLRQEFPKDVEEMTKKLKSFGTELAAHFEEQAHKELDELGIDVGIDKQGRFWLYEINSRPGFPANLLGKVGLEESLIGYAIYLANRNMS